MWAHKWKIIFNLDISKQAQEVVFSRKTDKVNHIPLTFNVIAVAQTSHQQHLGLYLDGKFYFNYKKRNFIKEKKSIKEIISNANKGIGIIRKLRSILPRNALLTTAFEIQLGTWQLLRLLPREICIFSSVPRQIIAEVKLS